MCKHIMKLIHNQKLLIAVSIYRKVLDKKGKNPYNNEKE